MEARYPIRKDNGGDAMEKLRIGARVEVKRIDGEAQRGYILRGPLECLRHIGDFYHVGLLEPKAPVKI